MRRTFLGLAALLTLLAVTVAVGPLLVDWNRWRPEIADAFRAETGLHIRIDGGAVLALLPAPRLHLSGVTLAETDAADAPAVLTARALDLRLSLPALFQGAVQVESVDLLEPTARIRSVPDGGSALLDLPSGNRGGPGGAIRELRIARVAVADGALFYGTGGASLRLENINFVASAASADGPFRLDGSFYRQGRRYVTEASTGRRAAGSLGLQLSLQAPAASLAFDGALERSVSGFALRGNARVEGTSLAKAARDLGAGDRTGFPALPFSLSGRLDAHDAAVRLEAAEFSVGPLSATGAAAFSYAAAPHLALRLALSQLDLQQALQSGAIEAAAILPRIQSWTASLETTVDAATWRGQSVRDVRAAASVADGNISIQRLSALLPGDGRAVLAGSVAMQPALSAAGTVELSADNARALLAWFGLPMTSVPGERMRKAALSAHFSASPDSIALDPFSLDLDAMHLTGAGSLALGSQAGLHARVAADTVNLDAYFPAGTAASALLGAAAAIPAPIEAEAAIGTLIVGNRPFQDVRVSGSVTRNGIDVRQARFRDGSGASADLAGTITDLAALVPTVSGRLRVEGPDLSLFLVQAAPAWPAEIAAGPFAIEAELGTAESGIAGQTRISVLGGTAALRGMLALGADHPRLDAQLRIEHPSYARLMRSLVGADPGETGPVAISARLSGDDHSLTLDPLSIAIGERKLDGRGGLAIARRPHLEMALAGGTLALDGLFGSASAPDRAAAAPKTFASLGPLRIDTDLSLAADRLSYRGWTLDRAGATLSLRKGRLSVNDVTGDLFGGRLGGSLALDLTALPQWTLDFGVRGAELGSLLRDPRGGAIVAGRADAALSLAAVGDNLAEVAQTLSGTATLHAADGVLNGLDLRALVASLDEPSQPAASTALTGALHGGTPVRSLTARFSVSNGIAVSEDLALALDGGAGRGEASLDVPAGTLRARALISLDGMPSASAMAILLSGPLGAPHSSVEWIATEAQALGRAPALR